MISSFDKCLYIHIPKTAGQSIESVFLERAGLSWEQRHEMLLMPNSDPDKGPPRLAHLTAQEYLNYGYLTQRELNQLFRFTFVRNPWDRLVSEYRYKKHKFSFKDFVFNYFPEKGVDDYKGLNGIYRHVMPQYLFIYDDDGNCQVDYIGKFENLKEDFATVSEKICGQKLSIPHRNKTPSSMYNVLAKQLNFSRKETECNYQTFYDDESREFVAEFYHQDIKLFNYSF